MKMKKTDIGVVVFMYAVCAFFYAYSYKLTEESKTYPMFTIALLFALTTLYLVQMIINARKFGVESGADEVFEEELTRVLAGACGGLKDNRGTGFLGCFHDGLNLFEVIDVKRRNTVAVLGRVVEKLAHCNKSHLLRLRKMVFWGRYRLKGGDILTKEGAFHIPNPRSINPE